MTPQGMEPTTFRLVAQLKLLMFVMGTKYVGRENIPKITVFHDTMPCSSVDGYQRFGAGCYLLRQGRDGAGVREVEVGTW
jgi:hypothetical protein